MRALSATVILSLFAVAVATIPLKSSLLKSSLCKTAAASTRLARLPGLPIIKRPIITKPIVRIVRVPIFVPRLLGVTGLAKTIGSMINPLAPTKALPLARTISYPPLLRSSEGRFGRPKVEDDDSKSYNSDENISSGEHWAETLQKQVHPVDRMRHTTRNIISRAFRSFINHEEHSLRSLGPAFQPAHHALSAVGQSILPHPRTEGVGQPLPPLLFHQWPTKRF